MNRLFFSYRYELIAALSGASVMILELVGARMAAPYFGTSIYVWTAMIGVILGALSLGYWYGGRLADRHADDAGLAKIISIAALCIFALAFVSEPILEVVSAMTIDIRFQAVIAAAILFAPAATLLGVVSPYVAKLKVSSLETAGASIGQLYAAGTLGSILGTFLAGYWLIGWFGNRSLGLGLVIALVLTSLVAHWQRGVRYRAVLVAVSVLALMNPPALQTGVQADIDSPYARYQVVDVKRDLYTERRLVTDKFSIQSAQAVEYPNELVLGYTEQFMKVARAVNPSDTLVIGGGVFTFPLALSKVYPSANHTSVEIDPELRNVASKYFSLPEKPQMNIVTEDGRVYLNEARAGTFDVIYLDAYSSLTPPYQLTTVEAVAHTKRMLRPNGVTVANVVASPLDEQYLPALMSTFRAVYPAVAAYPLRSATSDTTQNIIVVMGDAQRVAAVGAALGGEPIAVSGAQILTDDFAPVEQLIWRERG